MGKKNKRYVEIIQLSKVEIKSRKQKAFLPLFCLSSFSNIHETDAIYKDIELLTYMYNKVRVLSNI